MQNKTKRAIVKEIDRKARGTLENYESEFGYLANSGIALGARAIANPSFPLPESSCKSLLKLYLNDVGMLTSVLYGDNPAAILQDIPSGNSALSMKRLSPAN